MSGPETASPGRPPAFVYRASGPAGARARTLFCEGRALDRLAEDFGTPLYVYSGSLIGRRARAIDRAFRPLPHTICYAVKANSNLSILALLAGVGCGFDVVSGGELQRVERVDRRLAAKVVFSGVGKTRADILHALRAGILLFNVESESELHTLAECAAQARRRAAIALRVNPDVSAETHPYISTGLRAHKFGIPIGAARALYAQVAATKHLRAAGVSVHIGSQITDVRPFAEAISRVADLIRELRADGHAIEYVDAGGGLGISYDSAANLRVPELLPDYAAALLAPLRGLDVHLLLEPGRSIVGPAGVLLTRVLYRKSNGAKNFLVVDAAMNDLIRPALYQAHHEIAPVRRRGKAPAEIADVVGPICETGDFFARDRSLPPVREGDLLAILDAGAYGMALASNYNSRPRAAEVLVEGTGVRLIRRRETISDLLRPEALPAKPTRP